MAAKKHSSASQVNTAEACLRKWAFGKIDKIRGKVGKGALLGTETHSQISDFYVNRQTFKFQGNDRERHAANLATAIIAHLPPPQTPNVEIEKGWYLEVDGINFLMYIDIAIYDLEVPWVSDHKTTSDFRWALNEDNIHNDAQAALYAMYAMCRTGKTEVDLQWTYVRTKGSAQTLPIKKRVTLEMITPRMERSVETSKQLQLIRDTPGIKAMDVSYDASACEMYGGCPYQDLCNLTPQERMSSIMNQGAKKDDFMAKLKARQAKQAGATTHPPPANPTPAAAPEPDPPAVNPPEAAPEPAAAPAPPKSAPQTQKPAKTPKKPKTPAKAPTPAPVHTEEPPPYGATAKGLVDLCMTYYRQGFQDGLAQK